LKLFKTSNGILLQANAVYFLLNHDWDSLVNRDALFSYLDSQTQLAQKVPVEQAEKWIAENLLPPIGQQEVWAAGVTYLRSRDARKEESADSGASDLYDKVYHAERPELFFKSLPHRVSGHGQPVNIRRDSDWNVPEPECTLYINSAGTVQAYTIGNDMSSRSIEGENALYLPQAKMYEKSAALGPCLYIPESELSKETKISMRILRNEICLYEDAAQLNRMKRNFPELAGFLFREFIFPNGCYLMTGTCLVPPNDFTLQENDRIEISIENIGTLSNTVALKPQTP
jgi:2-dehydro-3-deoxy-D-arabinonate dehydratase